MADVTLLSQYAGPRGPLADGSIISGQRIDKDGHLTTTPGHGSYNEAARRKKMFATCNQSGVASQSGLSGTTPVLALYNPVGSGVNLSLIACSAIFPVAVAAGGLYAVLASFAGVPTALGSGAVVRNMFLNNDTAPLATPLLAATLLAAPVAIALLGFVGSAATTVSESLPAMTRYFDGGVIIPPGFGVTVQTILNASGALGMLNEYVWEELPV